MALVAVKYKGLADQREISKSDLKNTGVKIDRDLVWNKRNGNVQYVEANERLLEILRGEGHFTVSTVTDDRAEGAVIVVASAEGEEEADVLVDDTTGASTETDRSA